jgi:hypothetical protein
MRLGLYVTGKGAPLNVVNQAFMPEPASRCTAPWHLLVEQQYVVTEASRHCSAHRHRKSVQMRKSALQNVLA